MKLIDGFPTGRSAIADTPAPLRQAATDSAASDAGRGAAFGDILSEVSKGGGVVEAPAPLGAFDAAAPASIRGTFSVSIGAAVEGDGGLPPPGVTANVAGETGAGGAASAAPAYSSPLSYAADRSLITKPGVANSGPATTFADGGGSGGLTVAATWRPAQGANASTAATLALQTSPPGPRLPSTTDAGDASTATKRRVETKVAPTAAASANSSLANSSLANVSGANVIPTSACGQAAGAPAMAAQFGGAAGALAPASFSSGGVSFAPDSASVSKNSALVRGAAPRARGGEQMLSGGATGNMRSDSAALQSLTQPFSAAAGALPSSPRALSEGASSNKAPAASMLAAPVPSNVGLAQVRTPAPMIATQASSQGLEQGASAPATGDATGFSPIESAPLRVGAPAAATGQNPVKVAVLDRQMHFPPLAPSSAIDQIANRIVAEAGQPSAPAAPDVGGGASSGVAPSSGAATVQPQASLSATRVLNLQLEPEGLGAVSIRMRLSGDRLDVQVEATRADTMRRIGDDRDLLVEKLRSAGYAMDHIVVRAAEPQAAQTQHGLGSGESRGSEGRGEVPVPSPGMSQQGGSSANEGSGARRNGAPSRTLAVGAEDRSVGRDDSGAVYL